MDICWEHLRGDGNAHSRGGSRGPSGSISLAHMGSHRPPAKQSLIALTGSKTSHTRSLEGSSIIPVRAVWCRQEISTRLYDDSVREDAEASVVACIIVGLELAALNCVTCLRSACVCRRPKRCATGFQLKRPIRHAPMHARGAPAV